MTHHAVYDFDSFEFVRQKKREGKIRHIGFSFHDKPEALIEAFEAFPDCEFVQLQINYLDWDSSSIESKRCYEIACEYNKPVFVMEPVKGGALANLPKNAEELFKEYDADSENVSWKDVVVGGSSGGNESGNEGWGGSLDILELAKRVTYMSSRNMTQTGTGYYYYNVNDADFKINADSNQ